MLLYSYINNKFSNMKKISTSALSKILKVDWKELIEFLLNNWFIEVKNKSFFSKDKIKVLTDKWIKYWWELKTWTKFWDYIVWPENFNPYKILWVKNIEYISVTEISNILKIPAKKINIIISEIWWMEHTIKWWKLTKLWESIWWKQLIYNKTWKEYVKWPKEIINNDILKKSLNIKSENEENTDSIEKRELEKKNEESDFREKFKAGSRAKDWHFVRSRWEMLIDNALYEFKLVHAYERKLPVKEDIYSDFYIPAQRWWQAVYIEYWGYENNEKYLKRKEIKKEVYKKYNLNLIEIENKHIDNLDDYLPRLLLNYNINVD